MILPTIFFILGFICLVLLVVGLFSPASSLFWIKEKTKCTRGKSTVVYLLSFAVLLILVMVSAPEGASVRKVQTDTEESDSVVDAADDDDSEVAQAEEPQNWTYEEEKDEMSGEMKYFASCTSTNTHEFQFPYEGGSCLYIYVRNMGGKNSVCLQISKGQIMPSILGNQSIRFKFDGGEPVSYSYNGSSDGSPEYAFMERSAALIKQLKAAKTVKVDLPIFQENRPIFEFDVEGLKWER